MYFRRRIYRKKNFGKNSWVLSFNQILLIDSLIYSHLCFLLICTQKQIKEVDLVTENHKKLFYERNLRNYHSSFASTHN